MTILYGIFLYIYKHTCTISFTLQLLFSKFSKPQKHWTNGSFHWDLPVDNILPHLLYAPISFDWNIWLYITHIMTLFNQILRHMYSKIRVFLCQMSLAFSFVLAVQGLHCCAWVFSSCGKQGLLPSCDARASHYSGFSCCRARALWHAGFNNY